MYNIAAAESVDREFGGPSKGQIGPFKGSVKGSFSNVVGLPKELLVKFLVELEI